MGEIQDTPFSKGRTEKAVRIVPRGSDLLFFYSIHHTLEK